MALTLYYTTITPNQKAKSHQIKMMSILDSKKIDYVKVDVSCTENEQQKIDMQTKVIKAKSLKNNPVMPQLFRGDEYLGDFDDFELAVEEERIPEFLKLGDAQ